MGQKLKGFKVHFGITTLLEVIVGAVLLVWPGLSLTMVCRMVGGVLIFMALVHLVGYLAAENGTFFKSMEMMLTIVFAAVGLLICLNPKIVVGIIPFIMGATLLMHGLYDMQKASFLIKNKDSQWGLSFVLALLTIGCGVLLLWNPFSAVEMVVRIIGATMVYDGLSDAFIGFRAGKVEKRLRRAMQDAASETIVYTDGAGNTTVVQDVVLDPKHPGHVIDEKNIID